MNNGFRMGMPSAKKRRLDLEDSFEEDPVIVNKSNSPNDSFDEDVEIEPGPSLVVERILQTQALQQNRQATQGLNRPPSVNQPLNRIPSTDASTFQRHVKPKSPTISTQSTTSTILTGGHKESGVVLMLNKRNENLSRQLDDARREKVSKELYHLQEKKMMEDNYKKQLKTIQSEKEQLQRELVSMSFRQENYLNMTIADIHNNSVGHKTFVPTKPVDRRPGPQQSSRLAWMKRPNSSINSTFKQPIQPHPDDRDDLSYVHVSTQLMENSMFISQFDRENEPHHVEAPKIPTVDSECQTEKEVSRHIINVSQREAVIEGLLSSASRMSVEDFNACNLRDLCRNSQYKPLVRAKSRSGQ